MGDDLIICIDGASRGNPGEAAIGVVVRRNGVPVREIGESIGIATNNIAEYHAFLRGLEEAEALGARTLRVQSDSELLVRQLTGQYKVRSAALAGLHRQARARMRRFDGVSIIHVPREDNAAADALANRALDEAQRGRARSGVTRRARAPLGLPRVPKPRHR